MALLCCGKPKEYSPTKEGILSNRYQCLKDMMETLNNLNVKHGKGAFFAVVAQYISILFPLSLSCSVAEVIEVGNLQDEDHTYKTTFWVTTGVQLPDPLRLKHGEFAYHVILSGRSKLEMNVATSRYKDVTSLHQSYPDRSVILTPFTCTDQRLGYVMIFSSTANLTNEDVYWAEFFAGCLAYPIADLRHTEKLLAASRLLSRMIPAGAIAALQEQDSYIPGRGKPRDLFIEKHECVSVLCLNLDGINPHTNDEDCMRIIHRLFSDFDEICMSLHIYKVNTSETNYIVAAGLVRSRLQSESALLCIMAACLFIEAANKANREEATSLKVRVGIATGPLNSGVVSKLRPRYAIYGHTVQLARHIMDTSSGGLVNVSSATKALVPNYVTSLPWKEGTQCEDVWVLEPTDFPFMASAEIVNLLENENAPQQEFV